MLEAKKSESFGQRIRDFSSLRVAHSKGISSNGTMGSDEFSSIHNSDILFICGAWKRNFFTQQTRKQKMMLLAFSYAPQDVHGALSGRLSGHNSIPVVKKSEEELLYFKGYHLNCWTHCHREVIAWYFQHYSRAFREEGKKTNKTSTQFIS